MTISKISQPLTFISEHSTEATLKFSVGELTVTAFFKMKNEKVEITKDDKIQLLEETGINFDSDINNQITTYEDMVKNQKEIFAKQKEEESRKLYAEWKRPEVPTIDGVTYEWETEERFIKRHSNYSYNTYLYPVVNYKNTSIRIVRQDVGRSYSKNMKYTLDGSLTNYKRRNYSTYEKAVKKLVELTDQKIQNEIDSKESALRATNKREEKLAKLNSLFEWEVIEKREYKSNYYSRRGEGHHVYRYYLVIGEKEINIEGVYNDENLYQFGGLGKLTVETINAIGDFL